MIFKTKYLRYILVNLLLIAAVIGTQAQSIYPVQVAMQLTGSDGVGDSSEILLATSMLTVDSYRPELQQSVLGREVLQTYDAFMTLFVIYQGGKIVAGLPEAFTKLKSAWTKYGKQIPAIDNEIATLEKEIQKTEAIVAKDGNRLFANIDEFKAAIGRGENVFYVGKHSDIIPRPTGVQSHHGVNTVWVKNNYVNYVEANAPSVYMLNNPNHNATRGVFNTWRTEISKVQGVNVSNIDYSKITKADILKLAERQFDAADVPKVVRDEYYKLWEDYLKTLIKK